ncbi:MULTISPECIES: hypothetical protein [unclassified Streptomyces]|uniref:hypothetical protein n=1 Tax=unclassified Streptomyces TaxID=2593676 RepID=UPI0036931738
MGAGLTDGEARVEQGGDPRVLTGAAVVEGGAGELDGLAVASLDPGLHRQIRPGTRTAAVESPAS